MKQDVLLNTIGAASELMSILLILYLSYEFLLFLKN